MFFRVVFEKKLQKYLKTNQAIKIINDSFKIMYVLHVSNTEVKFRNRQVQINTYDGPPEWESN